MSDPRVIVVMGASTGVGRAVARACGARGDQVGLLARNRDGLEAARSEIEKAGGMALPVPTDVAEHEQVDAAAEVVESELGAIDVWVNDAMTTVFSPLREIEPEEFERATAVTYLGTVWGTMAALRRMIPRDRGRIVQVGSALAYRGIPLQAPYCGAKHAIKGFTEALRCELLHERSSVTVSMVQLPGLNTPQFEHCRTRLPKHPQPVPPIYQPEVAAKAILRAADTGRREIYVGVPTWRAIWGGKLFARLADRYLARTGYDSQQTDEPVDRGRLDNLFDTVPGDHGAHGRFDDRARRRTLRFR